MPCFRRSAAAADSGRQRNTNTDDYASPHGQPDVAKAALFLVSDEATHINGHIMLVDGGWMAVRHIPSRLATTVLSPTIMPVAAWIQRSSRDTNRRHFF
uniref:SDR family oxidoreductase n=1 Tax=Rhizobium laguerreae TaxID=1076926 RepID=A0A6N9Z8R8_9HYPH|nr:SDR family oxidoreductase [Rhizobium laguerreae]